MEQTVQFRDYQEQVADDHNNIQKFSRDAMDNVVRDVVTKGRAYSALTVQKTGQVEISVSPGRVYDNGAVYGRRTTLVQSMATFTAAAARRIVAVAAYGVEVDAGTEQRDFVVDVTTRATEPRGVAMTKSRDVQIVFVAGAEAADPTPPPIPANQVVIAHVLMDTTQVLSVTMLTANAVESTDSLNLRARALETFKGQIEPRVSSLGADLADLANQLRSSPSASTLGRIQLDLARVKAALKFPPSASGYGSFPYLDQSYSDMTNAAGLGFDARVEMGVRFPTANAANVPISLFAANDPNARMTGGLLLPAYTEEDKLNTGWPDTELGIAQYGFQTLQTKTGYMSRSRIRYGGSYTACSNGVNWGIDGEPNPAANLYDFGTTLIEAVQRIDYDVSNPGHESYWRNSYWFDTWKEPYDYSVATNGSIAGAFVAQTLLVTNDMWLTSIGYHLYAKAANEDMKILVCEVTNGQPDLSKVMLSAVQAHAAMKPNDHNIVSVKPTFLQKGKRIAVCMISNANHKIGMTNGQNYLDGTFFYSTDGIFYQGDLTKDMTVHLYGAKFNAPQVTIEFTGLNLDGGLRDIDILAEQWVPDSCQLIYEVRPSGTGQWQPLTSDNVNALSTAPALCQFRARFVGTRDMQPAINLPNSRVFISRPKTTLKYVSEPEAVPATSTITVKYLLEHFDETPHSFIPSLYVTAGTSGTIPRVETPDSVVTKLISLPDGRYERTCIFNLAAPVTAFRFVMDGQTNSAANTYHVASNDYYIS
ncbi:hypothetical protein [uncultured Methylobacterium sp.]|jgi:hypothetical protein|uniref:hypothetical protein n=1 Tax=uncultured Methylobacterium sp. TaxID=157278 RepID=UPI00261ED3EF|nr:hypothetical protein [uncultured Methylobacterium sp.]